MGNCCCGPRSPPVLPSPPAGSTEYKEFERLMGEELSPGNPHGWIIKKDWPAQFKDGFKMRVCLRPHESGNRNLLLRGDGRYRGVEARSFVDFLLSPELPGLQEITEVEKLSDGYIKYCRVKLPGFAERDHCWRYTIRDLEDGSIFVCIRSTTHHQCPVKPGVIRAYYYNSCLFKSVSAEDGSVVTEMTEFIFQDLGGSIPPCLLNAALPSGTIQANAAEMEHFRLKGLARN